MGKRQFLIAFLIIAGLALGVPPASFGQDNPVIGRITINGAVTCVTAGSCVRFSSLPVNNGSVGIQVTGTYTGTLSFESTVDGANYVAAVGCVGASGSTTSTTTTGAFQCTAGGLTGFQVRGSAAMTGTAVVTIQSGAGSIGGGTSTVGGTVSVDVVGNTIGLATSALQTTGNGSLGATTLDRCTTTDTTACALVGLAKQLNYLLGTAVGPATAANSNPFIQSYNTLASGAVTTAMTGTTSTSVIGATASNYIYVQQCVTSNSSTTVPTDILLQDGSGGTTLYVLPAPAGTGTGTGANGGTFVFPSPLKVTTSGNALYAVNVTTGSSTKISCSGFKSTISY